MPKNNLKHYGKIMNKLENFAEVSGIKIERGEEPGDGSFHHSTNTIILDEDLESTAEIATLLHELGHAYDYKLAIKPLSNRIFSAYDRIYEPDRVPSKRDMDLVMAAEVRAWCNAELIAKRLKIKLGKWFFSERKACLSDYRRSK